MEWYEIAVDGGRTVKFTARSLLPTVPQQQLNQQQPQQQQKEQINTTSDYTEDFAVTRTSGGIIKRGEWAWLANGCTLQIVALRNGQTVSIYDFSESRGYESCYIRCVEELYPYNTETVLLAVCLENFRAPSGGCSYVALYSVEHSKVLCCMEMQLHITTAAFIGQNCCRLSLLQNFDGCLAVGSEEGVVVLMDLNMRRVLELQMEQMLIDRFTTCHTVDYNLPLPEVHRKFQQCRQDGLHFGLQLEVIDTPCAVQSLLSIDLILGLVIGLEDGRLAFYDLAEMQIFHIALPGPHESMAPVVKMCYIEPLDDPRHCLYVWAMHENDDNLNAVLHTLIYEKRMLETDGFYYFETFVTSSVRLNLPLEATKSTAIACQTISKVTTGPNVLQVDEDANCLCALSWYSVLEEKNKLLIFDLNQWYKEEMPYTINHYKNTNYLAGYILSGRQNSLHCYLNPSTIAHFNSMQRFEEHFYPNSLSFDSLLLIEDGCRGYTWIGAQNKFINMLRSSNAGIFLEPEPYFKEILRTRLLPQFLELNVESTFSRNAKYETILSVALEQNCFSLLRDCGRSWADGSFMGGNFATATGISLSTLTEWIWKRATDIKTRCNELSKGLFNENGYPLDQREQKELSFITRQLKLLSDLLSEVLASAKRHIPENVFANLESRYKSLRIASEYQEVLMWLVNIGLLPEAYNYKYNSRKSNTKRNSIVYPYADLKELYTQKRNFFGTLSENFISKKTGSCRLLFIDAFIEHECKGDFLRENWVENGGNGLYPPTSIEAMLHVMLVPEMKFETKCAMLLYFFLDLHMTIDEQAHKEVVASFIKFPSVFMLTAPLIKTIQAFWNLDHGNFVSAVDEFISPFNNHQTYSQWMLELLIDALLTQNASHLALRILEARSTLISPVLKLNTLLANGLISEAFHFARSTNDETLLELFFKCCLCAGKYSVIRDLALTEKEGQLVQRILKRSKTHGAENLHFVYLLQKSKYIEAVSYLDELSRTKSLRAQFGTDNTTDTPNLVLSAFNTTMAPVTQGLTDVYFRIKNKIKKKEADNKSPVPLSCQLIKQNANDMLGGIYHSSALSAHFATYYWGEMETMNRDTPAVNLLNTNNAPFLRKPQAEAFYLDNSEQSNISYPQPYKLREKRTLAEVELQDANDALERQQSLSRQNPKKRRRLLGQEIFDDLSHFIEFNKNASHLNESGFNLTAKLPEQSMISNTSAHIPTVTSMETTRKAEGSTINFLTQPLTPRRPLTSEAENVLRSSSTELHGILKTNTPERIERAHSIRRELGVDEGKNLRFKLPVSELLKESPELTMYATAKNITPTVSPRRRLITTSTIDDTPDDDKEAFEVIVEVNEQTPQSTPNKRSSVARSVSVDSDNSDASKSAAQSEDEDFYSPLSSRNNSMIVDHLRSPLATTTPTTITEKVSFLSGPQARKPLTQYSVDRSAKSLSPVLKSSITPETSKVSPTHKAKEYKKMALSDIIHLDQRPTNTHIVNLETEAPTKSAVQITSAVSSISAIGPFIPQSSSSKICGRESKFLLERSVAEQVKISECKTIVGAPSTMEVDTTSPSHIQLNTIISDDQKIHDTTLDMSSCDIPYENEKSELVPAKSSTLPDEETEVEEIKEAELSVYEDVEMNDSELVPTTVDNKLMDEALGISATSPLADDAGADDPDDGDNSDEIDMYYKEIQTKILQHNDACDDNNEVIILSSSSSSNAADQSDDDDVHSVSISKQINTDSDSENDDNDYDDEEDEDDEDGEDDEEAYEEGEDEEFENEDSNLEQENIWSHKQANVENDSNESTEGNSNSTKLTDSTEESSERFAADNEGKNDSPKPTSSSENEILQPEESNNSSMKDDISVKFEMTHVVIEEMIDGNPSNNEEISTNQITYEEDLIRVENVIDEMCEDGIHVIKQGNEEITIQELHVETQIAEGIQVYGEAFYHVTEESCERFNSGHDEKIDSSPTLRTEVTSNLDKIETQTIDVSEKLPEQLMQCSESNDTDLAHTEVRSEEINEKVAESLSINTAEEVIYIDENNTQKSTQIIQSVTVESTITEDVSIVDKAQGINQVAEVDEEEEPISLHVEEDELSEAEIEKTTDMDSVKIVDSKSTQDIIKTHKEELKSKVEAVENDVADTATTSQSLKEETAEQVGQDAALDLTPRRRTNSISKTLEDADKILSGHHTRSARSASVSPTEQNSIGRVSTPQALSELEDAAAVPTPRTRHSMRASSQQPQILLNEEVSNLASILDASDTPRTRRNMRGTSVPHDAVVAVESTATPTRHARGTSVPPTSVSINAATKITTRRRSTMLDAINEHTPVPLDSPSARTRSRMRLNSMDSELDASIASGGGGSERPKSTRRTSLSSNMSEQPNTPKRRRRSSVATSQTESISTPRALRRSTRKQSAETSPNISASPVKDNVETTTTTKKSSESPKSENVDDISPTSTSMLYSSARRLTRTQLAMLEKSAALHKQTADSLATVTNISPPIARRVSKRRGSRSTVHDSDEIESISSHISNASHPSKRRVTRSSVKDKDDLDDDLMSIASSLGSERPSKRRSKDNKNSPNTTLGTIKEDEEEEEEDHKKQKRVRPPKKRYT